METILIFSSCCLDRFKITFLGLSELGSPGLFRAGLVGTAPGLE